MNTIAQLQAENDRMTKAATTACDAVQDLARTAGGNNGHVIPAPTAYDLLGNIKVLLIHLREVTDHMPRGLNASLDDTRIVVHDRNDFTGEERGPAQQIALAAQCLTALSASLDAATSHAEIAQTALNSQGYTEAP